MTQSEIARRYGVDRIALTRTLSRLAEDGLIAKNKGHGWTFLPTFDSLVSLKGSYEFRLTLEPACFLLPTFKPDLAAIERMRLQHLYLISHPDIATVSSAQLFETDAAFHEMCAEFAAMRSSFRPSSTRTGCGGCWNSAAISTVAASRTGAASTSRLSRRSQQAI